MQLPTFQPRFSLRGLFALVTLCAAGSWYWYQRPYPVQAKVESLWGVCRSGSLPTDPLPPKNFRIVQHFRRVRGKQPVKHGPYRGYDLQGKLLRSGYYVNGYEHGQFIDYSPDGGRTTWKMVRGRREGETRSVDGKGNVRSLSYFVNGKPHGSSRSWDAEGNFIEEENHDMGVLHGYYNRHDDSSGQTVSGEFDRELPSGSWKWSLRGSDIAEVSGQFENGRASGFWEWIATNGERKLAAEFKNW